MIAELEAAQSFPLGQMLTAIMVDPSDLKTIAGLLMLVLMLAGSALVSAAEVAFFSFRPEDIEHFRSDGDKRSQTALTLYNDPERLLSTILVANNTLNIAIVLLSAFISSVIFDFSAHPMTGFIINAVVITFILLFFGEIMPKVYATRNNKKVARLMASPLKFLEKLLYPVTAVLVLSSSFVRKRRGASRNTLSMNDLSDALELTSDNSDEDEKILKGIVNFGNINVSAIMCPRIDVTAIEIRSGFDKVIPVIISSGFSRIPVYSGTFDNVRGILYAKDVLPYTSNPSGFRWQTLLRSPYFVPETKKINDLLKEFQFKKMHMAVVIDEYGGTSGIVTLEDILEEIVGDITDESDDEELLYRKLDKNKYAFEGKILLNDFYKVLEIDDDIFEEVRGESETLAGLILELTGAIPEPGQKVCYDRFIFTVNSTDGRRIKEIFVEIVEKDEEDATE
jgi:putative hemolysin